MTFEKITKDLEEFAEKIKKAKKEQATCEGQLQSYLQTLKEEFDTDTIKEAEELLEQYKKERDNLQKEVEKKYNHLMENYQW